MRRITCTAKTVEIGMRMLFYIEKNQAFQKYLNEIHKPRVEFDYFWFIGSQFCSFYLCPIYPIREFCKNKIVKI